MATEVEILRQRVMTLQRTIEDMQVILNKTVTTSAVVATMAILEQRLVNIEERLEATESRLSIVEEEA
jgi:hypothetical protein